MDRKVKIQGNLGVLLSRHAQRASLGDIIDVPCSTISLL